MPHRTGRRRRMIQQKARVAHRRPLFLSLPSLSSGSLSDLPCSPSVSVFFAAAGDHHGAKAGASSSPWLPRSPAHLRQAALAALPRQPGRRRSLASPRHGHHKLQTTPGRLIAGNGFPRAGSGHSQPPRRTRTRTHPATPEQAPMGFESSMPCSGCSSGLLWFRSVQQMHHIQ